MNKTGFTLFEVSIVIMLVVLMVSLGMGYFRVIDRTLVRMELDKLYMLFVKLQQRARYEQKNLEISFDAVNNSYTYGNTVEKLAQGTQFGIIPNAKGPPSSPTTVLKNPVTFVDQRVIFYADGTIQAGTLYLTNTAHTILYALSCPISQVSYIRRYIFDKHWILVA